MVNNGKTIVFMFSGQGSQYYNMGKELYLNEPTFRKWMLRFESMIQDLTGESIIRRLYDDQKKLFEAFDRLLYTHPAIFMVEYSLAQVFLEKGIYPDYVLGSSLGEYTASVLANIISYEEAFQCIVNQAQIFERHCQKGGMLAVINDYSIYEEDPVLHENSELASVNFRSHFVVSGSWEGLKKIEEYLKGKNIIFQRLPVLYPFHSSFISPVGPSYMDSMKSTTLNEPSISYISCLTGNKAESFHKNYFWDIVSKPMDFQSASRYLQKEGDHIYLDLGPSGTMANFTKYNINHNPECIFTTITQFNKEMKSLEGIFSYLSNM